MSDSTRRLQSSADHELAKEVTFGGVGVEVDQSVDAIDISNFGDRRDRIDQEVWQAATATGFFQVTGHGISQDLIDSAFELAERFFATSRDHKSTLQMPPGTNSGWEYMSQRRPSTGSLDQKESYQVTVPRMDRLELWPAEQVVPEFKATMLAFEAANRALAMRLLSCFARKLGFSDTFFDERHDPASDGYQSTLRILHYLAMDEGDLDPTVWRAGAHTDFDCLTLLHQLPGQSGLQVSPGAEAARRSSPDQPLRWIPVSPTLGTVTCNIGDMLTRWSDDKLPSTLHRVRTPRSGEYLGPRYSIAYFAQADEDALIEGPDHRYAPISAANFLQQRIAANFSKDDR